MKYLVTGGAGFIGSHICDSLIERGDSVLVLDNLSTGDLRNVKHLVGHSRFKINQGSVLDVDIVNQSVASVDHVLHFAAAVGVFTIVNKPLESLRTNLRGTENILESAYHFEKEVFIASSSEVYGKNSSGSLNEDSDRIVGSPLTSRWSYSEAKAIDESLAYFYFQEMKLPVRLVRFFNTVGPRQVGRYGMVVPRFVSAALKNEALTVYGTGSQTRCFCHVSDAVEAVLKVIDSKMTVGEVFNIGNDNEITIEDLARSVIALTGSRSIIQKEPYESAYSQGFEDMYRRVPDITKIKKTLGWSPKHSLQDIISDIAGYLEN
jgi:UDP-glucose 4-epimerase